MNPAGYTEENGFGLPPGTASVEPEPEPNPKSESDPASSGWSAPGSWSLIIKGGPLEPEAAVYLKRKLSNEQLATLRIRLISTSSNRERLEQCMPSSSPNPATQKSLSGKRSPTRNPAPTTSSSRSPPAPSTAPTWRSASASTRRRPARPRTWAWSAQAQ